MSVNYKKKVNMQTKLIFYVLFDLNYSNANLIVRIIELVEGEPDANHGIPLIISPISRKYSIHFEQVSEFRSKSEPCFVGEGKHVDMTDFLREYTDSEYVKQICPFGIGAKEVARHFCIFTTSVVLEVLSEKAPQIIFENNIIQQDILN